MARINWREEFDKVDEENMRLLCEKRAVEKNHYAGCLGLR